jgi:hypothetical protein
VDPGSVDGLDLAAVAATVHAVATLLLTGLAWTVQLVVYPGFREAAPAWPAAHEAHTRRTARAVGPPWAAQGLSVGALLLLRPDPLVLLAAALALVPVVSTVLLQVPLHRRLSRGYDAGAVDRLVRTSWLRTAAWSAGAVCGVALLP